MKRLILCALALSLVIFSGCEKETSGGLKGEWQVTYVAQYDQEGNMAREQVWEDYFSLTHTVFAFAAEGRGYHLHDGAGGEYEYEYDSKAKTLMITTVQEIMGDVSSPWIPSTGTMVVSSVEINDGKMTWHVTGQIVDGQTYEVNMKYELKRISKKTDFSQTIQGEEE